MKSAGEITVSWEHSIGPQAETWINRFSRIFWRVLGMRSLLVQIIEPG